MIWLVTVHTVPCGLNDVGLALNDRLKSLIKALNCHEKE